MLDPVEEVKPAEGEVKPAVPVEVEVKVEPAPVVEVKPEPKVESKDWKDARIAELTAKLNAEKAKRAAEPVPAVRDPGESQAEFDSRVTARAAEITAINEWNRQCNEVAAAGAAAFPDFDQRLAAFCSVVNPQDETEKAQFQELLATAIETGAGHKLIHALGETPGEVRRLMLLSPVKRAMELATKAAALGKSEPAPEPSGAPRPITPISSKGVHYDGIKPDDPANGTNLPIAEWMKQREKQAAERNIQ